MQMKSSILFFSYVHLPHKNMEQQKMVGLQAYNRQL